MAETEIDRKNIFRIATWNCLQGKDKFPEKLKKIVEWAEADIYVISECPKLDDDSDLLKNLNLQYAGWDGKEKGTAGVGIFIKYNHNVQKHPKGPENYDYHVLCTVNDKFHILGIWAHAVDSKKNYAPCLLKYIKKHSEIDCNYIITGDLNLDERVKGQNKQCKMDTKKIFEIFESAGLISAYRKATGELHGSENKKTYYRSVYKRIEKPARMVGENIHQPSCNILIPSSHIDYVFADERMIIDKSVKFGEPIEWLEYSDHLPLIVELKIK